MMQSNLFFMPPLHLLVPLILNKKYNGGAVPVSEVHEILTKIHDILDNAMSVWVFNGVDISVSL